MTDVPHFDLPLRIDPKTGHLAEVEQDSLDDLEACVEAVLLTMIGERDELPTFGVVDQAFQRTPLDLDSLAAQVVASEPRAAVLIEQDPEGFADAVQRIRVTVGQAGG